MIPGTPVDVCPGIRHQNCLHEY